MTRIVKPGVRGKPAPSLTVIYSIWYRVIKLLTFRHSNLKDQYGEHERSRISVHLDQLVKRKLLTKGKWFRKVWLGFLVVQRLAYCWVERALADGCLSWDRVLLKLLSILLQSACAARSGDVGRSKLYTGPQCLCFKDVELVLGSQEPVSVQNLSGKVTLRFTKGKKQVAAPLSYPKVRWS